jgi:hypothetical protein
MHTSGTRHEYISLAIGGGISLPSIDIQATDSNIASIADKPALVLPPNSHSLSLTSDVAPNINISVHVHGMERSNPMLTDSKTRNGSITVHQRPHWVRVWGVWCLVLDSGTGRRMPALCQNISHQACCQPDDQLPAVRRGAPEEMEAHRRNSGHVKKAVEVSWKTSTSSMTNRRILMASITTPAIDQSGC